MTAGQSPAGPEEHATVAGAGRSSGRCAVVAFGASSALGEGEQALGVGAAGDAAPVALGRDPELAAARLQRPFCGRVPEIEVPSGVDRATVLLARALAACATQLDACLPDWRSRRVGLALGTSSGGMRAFEAAFAEGGHPEGNADATYLGPVLAAARPCDVAPFALVLGACASGTLAIGLARAWLETGACDLALCGGFDAVSVFVASGFEVLRATCTDGAPRPFRAGRDGLALGEGAAILALVRQDMAKEVPALGYVAGFGASCDAVHLTAPDREGRGLARAAAHAIADAGAGPITLVSAHGTATEYNDAAEARALAAVLGERVGEVPLHALKGGIGHTLGAGGALETLAALQAMRTAIAPASAGNGEIDGGVRVLERALPHPARVALKLSAAFGGANAALVLTRDAGADPHRIATRDVHLSRAVALTGDVSAALDAHALAALCGYSEDRLARADGLVRLTIAAVARLRDALAAAGQGDLAGAGIVVGLGLATIDTNAAYLARIAAAGASRGEPRRFPYTTPNAAAGECAVAFGLTGPAFAVGCGPQGGLEALATAADLVRAGVAERIVVVAVDEAGPASRRVAPSTQPGAVALLVAATPLAARLESCTVSLSREGTFGVPAAVEAHRALLPLATDRPDTLSLDLGGGGFAQARMLWL